MRKAEPHFDIDYLDGYQGEMFNLDARASFMNGARIEVKTDRKVAATGNVYLEYSGWVSGHWAPTGIALSDGDASELITLNIANQVLVISYRDLLQAVARRFYAVPKLRVDGGLQGSNPTKGILAPASQLLPVLLSEATRLGRLADPTPVNGPGRLTRVEVAADYFRKAMDREEREALVSLLLKSLEVSGSAA